MEVRCNSLEEVRQKIDGIDREVVGLLACRGKLVAQAATFKQTTDDVRAPARVEQVIAKVRGIAAQPGASPQVVEQVYRAMRRPALRTERLPFGSLRAEVGIQDLFRRLSDDIERYAALSSIARCWHIPLGVENTQHPGGNGWRPAVEKVPYRTLLRCSAPIWARGVL